MNEIRQNDIFQLGMHRLLCGDGIDPGNIARLLGCAAGASPEDHYDLMITNPPFPGRNEPVDDYYMLWEKTFKNWNPRIFYGWISAMHSPQFTNLMTDKFDYRIKQQLVWLHEGKRSDRYSYRWDHTPCVYAIKPETSERWLNLFGHSPSTVFNCGFEDHEVDIARIYPTAKPSRLYSEILFYHDCNTIVDPFAGTGPLVKACEAMGKRALVAEIDPELCGVIIDQWQRFTGRKAIKETRTFHTVEFSETVCHI